MPTRVGGAFYALEDVGPNPYPVRVSRAKKTENRSLRMRLGRREPHYYTVAGPVTIRTAEGEERKEPALTPEQLAQVLKERWGIPLGVKRKVLRRDGGACRYCGSTDGPFELDHVVPIALGGSGRMENIVTACHDCNARKGASVWTPRPRHHPYPSSTASE